MNRVHRKLVIGSGKYDFRQRGFQGIQYPESIPTRHPNIQKNQIWTMLFNQFDRLIPIFRFRHNF